MGGLLTRELATTFAPIPVYSAREPCIFDKRALHVYICKCSKKVLNMRIFTGWNAGGLLTREPAAFAPSDFVGQHVPLHQLPAAVDILEGYAGVLYRRHFLELDLLAELSTGLSLSFPQQSPVYSLKDPCVCA